MVTIIDWQLVLEFVKALAAPIATLTAAVIAAKLAVRTFLGQKAIERRLEWFARLHQQVDALIACAVNIRSLMEIDNLEALEKAKGSSSQFPNNSEQPAMKVTFTRAKTFSPQFNGFAPRSFDSMPRSTLEAWIIRP